jgi:hypothetical protein
MRQIDLPLQIDHLRQLGADFTALHRTVKALEVRPGTEMLQHLAPKILAIHELAGRSLVRLSVLDGSQYTAVPGSRASLETLASVVTAASLAASDLATAVTHNPLDAAGFPGGPAADDASMRHARHAEAVPLLAESLADAAHQLDLCATGCHYTASGIARDIKNHPEHRPPLPKLTTAQHAALDKVAQGGARRYRPTRGNRVTIRAQDGSTIHTKPFTVLEQHRLVRIDHRTSALAGQHITVTAAGKLALETQRPSQARPAAPTAARASVPPAHRAARA